MKRILAITIITLLLCSCGTGEKSPALSGDTTQAPVKTDRPLDYDAMINGDFTAVAGEWINSDGDMILIRSDGITEEDAAGSGEYKAIAQPVVKNGDGSFSWTIGTYYNNECIDGYGITVFPAGVAASDYDGNKINTDESSPRLWVGNGDITSDYDFYYRK